MIIEHPNWRPGYEDGIAPNCPQCLMPMEPREEEWYCEDCELAKEPGQHL